MNGWSEYQTAEEMEVSRKYEYAPELVPILCKWLCPKPKPSSIVVDIGCGSGYFTKILAQCMRKQGKVIGIDPDERLIREARKISKSEHFSNIDFRKGNAWKIPLESNYADLVASHIVLSNIPRQLEAIMEMKRVAKIGGKVAVIDPARGGGMYFPDARQNELYDKFHKAFGAAIDIGWRQKLDMSKYVENYHFRIPELFMKARLVDIRLDGLLPTFLLCDARRTTKEMKTHLQARLNLWKKLEKRNKKLAVLGGMNEAEFQELYQKHAAYLQDLITHPRKIRKTPELDVYSRFIVQGTKSA